MTDRHADLLLFKSPNTEEVVLLEFQGVFVGEPDGQPLDPQHMQVRLEKLPNNGFLATINDSIQLEGTESKQEPPLGVCTEDADGFMVKAVASKRILFAKRPVYLIRDTHKKVTG
jgi:hypothetical protein